MLEEKNYIFHDIKCYNMLSKAYGFKIITDNQNITYAITDYDKNSNKYEYFGSSLVYNNKLYGNIHYTKFGPEYNLSDIPELVKIFKGKEIKYLLTNQDMNKEEYKYIKDTMKEYKDIKDVNIYGEYVENRLYIVTEDDYVLYMNVYNQVLSEHTGVCNLHDYYMGTEGIEERRTMV